MRLDLVEFAEQKQIRCSSGELHDERLRIEPQPHNPIVRFFFNGSDRRVTELCVQCLAKRTEMNGLFLKFFQAPPNQIHPRARRIDTYKQKLPAQPNIKRKRNRAKLKDFSEVSAGEIGAKLFDDALKELRVHFRLLRLPFE